MQAALGCCILLLYFFLPSTSANTLLALMVVIIHCNLHWWCFRWNTNAFTNVHTNKYAQFATCNVWWWWWLWLIVFLCGGDDCMWWWLYVVVVALLEGDGHPCVAVALLLCDCIHAWWSVMNEDATQTINMKRCTLSKHCAVMLGCRGYTSSQEKENKRKKASTDGFEPVTFCL